jgi:hypothetical protein
VVSTELLPALSSSELVAKRGRHQQAVQQACSGQPPCSHAAAAVMGGGHKRSAAQAAGHACGPISDFAAASMMIIQL